MLCKNKSLHPCQANDRQKRASLKKNVSNSFSKGTRKKEANIKPLLFCMTLFLQFGIHHLCLSHINLHSDKCLIKKTATNYANCHAKMQSKDDQTHLNKGAEIHTLAQAKGQSLSKQIENNFVLNVNKQIVHMEIQIPFPKVFFTQRLKHIPKQIRKKLKCRNTHHQPLFLWPYNILKYFVDCFLAKRNRIQVEYR